MMKKIGICLQTLIPVRSANSEQAEMVTQIIFGETYTINKSVDNWTNITLTYDYYEGWIDEKQLNELSNAQYSEINSAKNIMSSSVISYLTNLNTKTNIPIVAGSFLPSIDKFGILNIDNNKFEYLQKAEPFTSSVENIISIAKQFENAPYLWGGRTILGIDCSGFSQIVYKLVGIPLLRDASLQAKQGEKVDSISGAESGDLAFFNNEKGNITHVGIMINKTQIIHASGWVRIDTIDEKGIYNSDVDKYTHSLCDIRRFI